MRNRIVFGLLFVVLGGLVMALPFHILPVCETLLSLENGGSVPMKCHWMARAELGAGAVLAVLGVFCLFTRDPGVRMGLALGALPVAGLIAALPGGLIGVCPGPQMPCHGGTYPALVILSGGGALVGLLGLYFFRREAKAPGRFSPPGRDNGGG